MKPEHKALTLSILIGIICFLIWRFSGIELSQEIAPDYSVMPHPTDISIYDRFVFFIFAILLSTCFYFPFFLTEKYSKQRLLITSGLSVLFLFFAIDFIAPNAKGVLKANWFGEDYGFGVNLTKIFLLFPVFYCVYNGIAFGRLPFRSFFYLCFISYAIIYFSMFISSVFNGSGRYSFIAEGYFIFFYALALGFIGMDANREDLRQVGNEGEI